MSQTLKYITKTIFILVVLLNQLSFASDEVVVGKGSTTLTIKPETASECLVTAIERYKRHFIFQYDFKQKDYYLITQNFEVGGGCFEGNNPANVSVTAQKIDVYNGQVSKKIIWSFSTKGVSGERAVYPLTGLYMVSYPGCCGSTSTDKYFSLLSGKFIGASSLSPLMIEIPNTTKVRYITVQDEHASDYMGKIRGAGTIFYSDKNNIRQELLIALSNSSNAYCYLTGLKFAGKNADSRSYSLWKKTTFEDVSIIIELGCDKVGSVTIEIPVITDMLSPDNAVIKGTSNAKVRDVTNNKTIKSIRQ